MDRLYDVFYTTKDGEEKTVRYCCIDKSQAKRLFLSEVQAGEELKRIKEVKEVPKFIKEKCKRIERLCMEAYVLRSEVEKWCKANGIDTNSDEWDNTVRDEIRGCDATLNVNGIIEMLNNLKECKEKNSGE